MRVKSKSIITTLCALLILSSTPSYAEVKFGVQAPRGALQALKRWGKMEDYLSSAVGEKVKLVPLKPNETVAAVSNGEVDFMLCNPVLGVTLQKNVNSIPIATMKKKSGAQFAGVIIASKKSGIKRVEQLKGKKVMGFKFKRSAAAYVFQVKHLMDKGIDSHKDFKVFKEAKKQDDIVLAVKAGVFDAGFIKSGLLESMIKEGKIKRSDIVVLDAKNDSLPDLHSTALYPEWTVMSASKVSSAKQQKVQKALLGLKGNHIAAKTAKIVGFVKPLSFAGLEDTLRTMKLPPFK